MRLKAAYIIGLLALVQTLHADPTSVSGSLTATGQTLALAVANNNTWGLQVSGTWTGSLVVEGTINSTSWAQLAGFQLPSNAAASTITASGLYFGPMPGMARVRVRAASIGSGTAVTTLTLQDSLSSIPTTSQAVSVVGGLTISSSALPSGAATASLQQAMTTQLQTIQTGLAGVTIAAMPAVTQGGAWTASVNVLTSPLPVSPVAAGLFGGGSLAAGTNYIGAVNISNSASAPVQVALASSSLAVPVSVTAFSPTIAVNVNSGAIDAAVQGAQAISSLLTTNPVVIGGQAQTGAGIRALRLGLEGELVAGTMVAGADGAANGNQMQLLDYAGNSGPLGTFPSLFNGTTWDRARGTSGAQHVSVTGGSLDVGLVRAVGVAVSVTAWPAARQGVSITASVGLPVSVTAWPADRLGVSVVAGYGTSLPAYTAAAPLPVSLTTISAAAPLSVTLPAITSANPLAASVTISAVAAGGLKTTGTGVDGLNVALAFDYDVNTKTANSRRGLDTTNSFFSTSGTTAVVASGYSLLYSITILPATIAGSKVTLFDGSTTRVAVSAQTAQHYIWPRGVAFKTGMTSVVTGSSFDGGVGLEWAQ